jgi:GntR family transcriptional regulator
MPAAVPVYQRIMTDIRAKIESGELRPGDKLPTINELIELYKCSGEPVKMALRMLSAAGDVVGHQGRGTFVAPGPQ